MVFVIISCSYWTVRVTTEIDCFAYRDSIGLVGTHLFSCDFRLWRASLDLERSDLLNKLGDLEIFIINILFIHHCEILVMSVVSTIKALTIVGIEEFIAFTNSLKLKLEWEIYQTTWCNVVSRMQLRVSF